MTETKSLHSMVKQLPLDCLCVEQQALKGLIISPAQLPEELAAHWPLFC